MKTNLKSKKIKLRKLKISDAEFLCRNAKDKDVTKYTYVFPPPFKIEKAKQFIEEADKNWNDKKEFEFGIELKDSKKLIGTANIFNIDYKKKKAEVGIWLSKEYWGKGLSKEALGSLLDFGFNKLKLKKFQARVFHKNTVTQKLLEKIGFEFKNRISKKTFFKNQWFDDLIYEYTKTEVDRSK